MYGLTIGDLDEHGFLVFDLKQILACLHDEALAREWRCAFVECVGQSGPELDALGQNGEVITGARLIELAANCDRIVWGDFYGRLPGEDDESLVIKAADGSDWEVYGPEASLQKIRTAFRSTKPVDR